MSQQASGERRRSAIIVEEKQAPAPGSVTEEGGEKDMQLKETRGPGRDGNRTGTEAGGREKGEEQSQKEGKTPYQRVLNRPGW